MSELVECPFCGGNIRIGFCDDEGNYPKQEGYEYDPWSGLSFCLLHYETDVPEGKTCPIATGCPDEKIGMYLYDSREDAIKAWNTCVFPGWLRDKIETRQEELESAINPIFQVNSRILRAVIEELGRVLSLTPEDKK